MDGLDNSNTNSAKSSAQQQHRAHTKIVRATTFNIQRDFSKHKFSNNKKLSFLRSPSSPTTDDSISLIK